jgi:antitoxin (DNA-binding transcriptional repressor) of toxin-antitoxin stability system
MKRAAVSTLKAALSACLAKLKAGNEVLIIEQGKPIAKLVPLSKVSHESETRWDLARTGLVRLGTDSLPAGFWKLTRPKDPTIKASTRCWQIGRKAYNGYGYP